MKMFDLKWGLHKASKQNKQGLRCTVSWSAIWIYHCSSFSADSSKENTLLFSWIEKLLPHKKLSEGQTNKLTNIYLCKFGKKIILSSHERTHDILYKMQ